MPGRIEMHFIPGPAGKLEAMLETPDQNEPRAVALVCHPHPKHGGTMHNKVVYRVARGLRAAGAAVLRFNFRGVNLSDGAYDHGIGELEDARSAMAWLRGRYPAAPYTLAGFSYGARIILRLGCQRRGAARLIAAGWPAAYMEESAYERCPAPRVFIQSTRDEFAPRSRMESFFATLEEPKRLIWIEAADHSFTGALEELERVVRELPAT